MKKREGKLPPAHHGGPNRSGCRKRPSAQPRPTLGRRTGATSGRLRRLQDHMDCTQLIISHKTAYARLQTLVEVEHHVIAECKVPVIQIWTRTPHGLLCRSRDRLPPRRQVRPRAWGTPKPRLYPHETARRKDAFRTFILCHASSEKAYEEEGRGGPSRNRTCDRSLTKRMLYQLSYRSTETKTSLSRPRPPHQVR